MRLIKEDLKNYRLVKGLNALGLTSSEYLLDIAYVVFRMMGFEEGQINDDLYQFYVKLINNLDTDELADPKLLNQFSANIFIELLAEKKIMERVS
jgi:hypothetical protein